MLFDTAFEAATQPDAKNATSGVVRGPLHGLHGSLKNCFKIVGTDATIGCAAFANQQTFQSEENEFTEILRPTDAILFCKTGVPLALTAGETYNPIHGYHTVATLTIEASPAEALVKANARRWYCEDLLLAWAPILVVPSVPYNSIC
ncbi:hypothetical protein MY10362_008009 [Beauveria mimosiformis]